MHWLRSSVIFLALAAMPPLIVLGAQEARAQSKWGPNDWAHAHCDNSMTVNYTYAIYSYTPESGGVLYLDNSQNMITFPTKPECQVFLGRMQRSNGSASRIARPKPSQKLPPKKAASSSVHRKASLSDLDKINQEMAQDNCEAMPNTRVCQKLQRRLEKISPVTPSGVAQGVDQEGGEPVVSDKPEAKFEDSSQGGMCPKGTEEAMSCSAKWTAGNTYLDYDCTNGGDRSVYVTVCDNAGGCPTVEVPPTGQSINVRQLNPYDRSQGRTSYVSAAYACKSGH